MPWNFTGLLQAWSIARKVPGIPSVLYVWKFLALILEVCLDQQYNFVSSFFHFCCFHLDRSSFKFVLMKQVFWSKDFDQTNIWSNTCLIRIVLIKKHYGWTNFCWSADWYYFNRNISCLICLIISKPFLGDLQTISDSFFPSTLARIVIKGIPINPHNDLEMSPNHPQSALEKLWHRSKAFIYETQVHFTNQVYLASAIVILLYRF